MAVDPGDPPRARPSWAAVVALVLAAGVGGVALGVVLADEDDTTGRTAAHMSSIRGACERWQDADPSQDPARCDVMVSWMLDRMDDETPSMMWGNSGRMRATCQRWVDDEPPPGVSDGKAWCHDMVQWMTEHMRDWSGHDHWDRWMDDGPMHGRG